MTNNIISTEQEFFKSAQEGKHYFAKRGFSLRFTGKEAKVFLISNSISHPLAVFKLDWVLSELNCDWNLLFENTIEQMTEMRSISADSIGENEHDDLGEFWAGVNQPK